MSKYMLKLFVQSEFPLDASKIEETVRGLAPDSMVSGSYTTQLGWSEADEYSHKAEEMVNRAESFLRKTDRGPSLPPAAEA